MQRQTRLPSHSRVKVQSPLWFSYDKKWVYHKSLQQNVFFKAFDILDKQILSTRCVRMGAFIADIFGILYKFVYTKKVIRRLVSSRRDKSIADGPTDGPTDGHTLL